jgi:phage baseplate assembly protein W
MKMVGTHDFDQADKEVEETLKVDLRLGETMFGADLSVTETGDISLARGEMNLAQAVLHRLRTIKGELFDTGHPAYGSTLYDFVGEPNNEMTRERIKLAVRNTLLAESRIKEILNVTVKRRSLTLEKGYQKQEKYSNSVSNVETKDMMTTSVEAEIVTTDPRMILSTVDIEISILPIGGSSPINIAFPFQLEVA